MGQTDDISGGVTFKVDVREKDLLNFKLYHNYHSVSGIATLLFGIVFLVICAVSYGHYNIVYTLMMAFFGLFFTVYTPIGMMLKVRRQMKSVGALGGELEYNVTEDGIKVSQGDENATLTWNDVFRIKATGSSIILYITSVRANIIPFRCIGDDAEAVIEIAQKKLTPYQIRLNKASVIKKCHDAAAKG